jgi:predicted CopG family antitoxin
MYLEPLKRTELEIIMSLKMEYEGEDIVRLVAKTLKVHYQIYLFFASEQMRS